MDISIVIVSYNVRAFLEKCLISVFRSSGDISYEVFVVDNNSIDDSVAVVRGKFSQAHLIANKENIGFARANNIAINKASGKYTLILNPDTVLSEDTLQTCLAFMERHPDAGSVGVKMVDGTGTYLPESKRGLPSPLGSMFKLTGINELFPNSSFFNSYYMGGLDPETTNKVPVLTGAFMFAQTRALQQVGGFDEDYFMYGEDIDLSYRLLKAGYENYYLPDTSIIHYKGESTKRSSIEYVKTFYNAMLIFVSKHYSGFKGFFLKQFLKLGIVLRGALSGVRRFLLLLMKPALDAIIITLSVLGIRYAWAKYYFGDVNHFDESFNQINLPLYAIVWILSLAFFGCYDKGRSTKRIAAGMLSGTALILIVYALLPQSLRSSRALILLVTPLIILALNVMTWVMQKVAGQRRKRRVAIVSSLHESRRIMELLNRVDPEVTIAGVISPEEGHAVGSDFIAGIDQLQAVVKEYRINELIFASSDVSFTVISRWMTRFGADVQYRIASHESDEIVGSDSKESAGQMYTTRIAFSIDDNLKRRNKRLFDIAIAIVVLITAPVLVLFRSGRTSIERAWKVLTGAFTWISYDRRDPELDQLPRLRNGFIFPTSGLSNVREIHTLNYIYAREYTVWKDIELILRTGRSN